MLRSNPLTKACEQNKACKVLCWTRGCLWWQMWSHWHRCTQWPLQNSTIGQTQKNHVYYFTIEQIWLSCTSRSICNTHYKYNNWPSRAIITDVKIENNIIAYGVCVWFSSWQNVICMSECVLFLKKSVFTVGYDNVSMVQAFKVVYSW